MAELLKKLLRDFLDSQVFPKIKALEDKIGSETVKEVVEGLTAAAEAQVDQFLA